MREADKGEIFPYKVVAKGGERISYHVQRPDGALTKGYTSAAAAYVVALVLRG